MVLWVFLVVELMCGVVIMFGRCSSGELGDSGLCLNMLRLVVWICCWVRVLIRVVLLIIWLWEMLMKIVCGCIWVNCVVLIRFLVVVVSGRVR